MKIAFLTRVDAFSKYGGDTYQLEMYCKYLEEMKHESKICFDLDVPVDFDCYILVNLDRPLELIVYYEKLCQMNLIKKTLFLTIHHDYKIIEFFEKTIRTGILYMPLKIFNGYLKREKFKNIVRCIKYKKLRFYTFKQLFMSYSEIIRKILIDIPLILIADKEKEIIERDFGIIIKKYFTVYNGVDIKPVIQKDWSRRDIDILVVGRIEPRKNVLALAKLLDNSPYQVRFVGAINMNVPNYCRKFKKIIMKSNNMKYLGKKSPSEMINVYCRSKICISASWFEVASLVDLESYAYGCNVIASTNGHTDCYLGGRINYIDPQNMNNILLMIPNLLQNIPDSDAQQLYIKEKYTWKRSTEQLLLSVNSALNHI
ncbi:MAG: glycosyltransferase family 4 protein [Flavobacteriaceae bacterium]|jgi:glycosyltransferase involved in cell wall biosynthesis|nr:glycosyltransferase family 4 protein [Flavobacteriaceae bacterium]